MKKHNVLKLIAIIVIFSLPIILTPSVFADAANGSVTQVDNFIRNIIQVIAGLAGLVATGFFVVGGFGYITSSGNPEHLDRSKKTLVYSAIGLTITISAFVLSNIITQIATKSFGN
jgi:TRAP-type C4-dicarboxylate transport system permease small subunit